MSWKEELDGMDAEDAMERNCKDVVPEEFTEDWEVQFYAIQLLRLGIAMNGQTWSLWHVDFAERVVAADFRLSGAA